MSDLRSLEKGVVKAFADRAKRFATSALFTRVMIAVGGLVSGIAQFAAASTSPTIGQIAGMIGSAVAFVGAVVIIMLDSDASTELALAQKAVSTARDIQAQLELFSRWDAELTRAIQLFSAVSRMRDIIASSLSVCVDEDELVRNVLEAAQQHLQIAADFKNTETWTICIYKAASDDGHPGKLTLRCVAHERSNRCEIGLARSWPEGHGVAGVAFVQNRPIMVPDLTAPELGTLYNLGPLRKTTDDELYRSIVAVPISPAQGKPPWGVVTATSSRPGHFDGNAGPSVRPAEAAIALARMVALAVASAPMSHHDPSGGDQAPPSAGACDDAPANPS